MNLDAGSKASILIESLPYIRRWSGKTVVIKVGGEVLDDPFTLDSFATDVTLLSFVGIQPVIVHGGGKQISQMMTGLGKEPVFIAGHRVTDAETMRIVRMVLIAEVNKQLVRAINSHGGTAAGISGEDGGLISATKASGPNGEDLGFVGEVSSVDPSIVESLIANEFIPVITPIGVGDDGSYNINADLAAGALAAALGAQKIVFLTNVAGLYADLGDEGSLISQTSTDRLVGLLAGGALHEGMIPKIKGVVDAMKQGVPQAHLLDGRVPHAVLLEIFTDEGIGTMVLP